jgi:hypothetical protein
MRRSLTLLGGWLAVALWLGMPACAGSSDPAPGGDGEACDAEAGCQEGLVCQELVCQVKAEVPDPLAACTPECGQAVCGPDGCGGSCGECGGLQACQAGACVCQPQCTGRSCGDDGCGGSCGDCDGGLNCLGGVCICTPDCTDLACGDDGCGGSCGSCVWPEACFDGVCDCENGCEPPECGDCPEGTECGYFADPADWCGGAGCAEELGYEGACGGEDGKTLLWCEDETTIAIDCDFFDPESGCAWSEEVGYFDCL